MEYVIKMEKENKIKKRYGDFMFLVFNKEKICAYIVSILTVFFLFFIANNSKDNTVQTSSNIRNNQNINNSNINVTTNLIKKDENINSKKVENVANKINN